MALAKEDKPINGTGVKYFWNNVKKISFTSKYEGSGQANESAYVYQLIAKLKASDDMSNGGSLLISGTLGSYETPNKIDMAIVTRDAFKVYGNKNIISQSSLDRVSIQIYKNTDNTYSVYLRKKSWHTFNFYISIVNSLICTTLNTTLPVESTTTPSGSLVWSFANDTDLFDLEKTTPTVYNPTITITQGGVSKGSFTLNQSSSKTIALDAGGFTPTLVWSGSGSSLSYSFTIGKCYLIEYDIDGAYDYLLFKKESISKDYKISRIRFYSSTYYIFGTVITVGTSTASFGAGSAIRLSTTSVLGSYSPTKKFHNVYEL